MLEPLDTLDTTDLGPGICVAEFGSIPFANDKFLFADVALSFFKFCAVNRTLDGSDVKMLLIFSSRRSSIDIDGRFNVGVWGRRRRDESCGVLNASSFNPGRE